MNAILRLLPLLTFVAATCAWLASLWVVFNHPKFRRKWLWTLATLPAFHLPWSPHPGVIATIWAPVGAAYVLLFAGFGPKPARLERPRPMELG